MHTPPPAAAEAQAMTKQLDSRTSAMLVAAKLQQESPIPRSSNVSVHSLCTELIQSNLIGFTESPQCSTFAYSVSIAFPCE